jgi:hypothetical protein
MFTYTFFVSVLSLIARADAYIVTGTDLEIASNSYESFDYSRDTNVRDIDYFFNGAGRDSYKGIPVYNF